MKTIKSLTCLAAIALSFAACQKNEISQIETSESSFTFSSIRPQLEDETRTEYTGSTIQWSRGDVIKMGFTVEGVWQNADGDATSDNGAKLFASTGLSAASETAEFVIPTKFKGTTEGEHVFYAIYPSSAASESFSYAPSASVTIPVSQVSSASTFASGADVMIGVSEKYPSRPSSSEVIPLEWTRLVAHGDITLKGLQNTLEGETITSIKLTAQDDADLVGYHYMNIETGVFTLPTSNTTANVITIPGDNLTIEENGNVEFWISILPATITSLKVEVETKKATYTREIDGIELAFAKNKRNTLAIKMSGVPRVEKEAGEQLFADGNYVIAYSDKMMVASASGSYQGYSTLVTTTDSEGRLIVDEEALWAFSYDGENEVYYIKSVSEDKFLSGSGSSTNLSLVAENNKAGFTGVETGEEDGPYSLTVTTSGTTRGIGFNIQSPRFAMYTGGQQQSILLKIIPAVKDITPSLSFTTTSKNVLASATTVQFDFEAKNLAAGEPTVAVDEDEDGIISVEAAPYVSDGAVIVTLVPNTENKEKTATLTVSATGLEDIVLTIIQAAYTGGSDTVTDELTYDLIGISGSSYTAWTGKTSKSSAVYAGKTAGGNSSIQLRSNGSDCGIVTTTSGGQVAKIKITWNSNSSSGRTVSIYGSNTAYTDASALYNSSTQGTLLGEIVYGTSTEIEVEGSYSFIGLRSKSNALYIDKIEITWE